MSKCGTIWQCDFCMGKEQVTDDCIPKGWATVPARTALFWELEANWPTRHICLGCVTAAARGARKALKERYGGEKRGSLEC